MLLMARCSGNGMFMLLAFLKWGWGGPVRGLLFHSSNLISFSIKGMNPSGRESLSRSTDVELKANQIKTIKVSKLSDKIRSLMYAKYAFNFALTA